MRNTPRHSRIALISGQRGACPADCLLDKGCGGHDIKRRRSHVDTERIDQAYEDPGADNHRPVLRP